MDHVASHSQSSTAQGRWQPLRPMPEGSRGFPVSTSLGSRKGGSAGEHSRLSLPRKGGGDPVGHGKEETVKIERNLQMGVNCNSSMEIVLCLFSLGKHLNNGNIFVGVGFNRPPPVCHAFSHSHPSHGLLTHPSFHNQGRTQSPIAHPLPTACSQWRPH